MSWKSFKGNIGVILLLGPWFLGLPIFFISSYFFYHFFGFIASFLWMVFVLVAPFKRSVLFHKIVRYFNCRNIFEKFISLDEEKVPEKGAMLCFHPHGIACIGFCFSGCWSPVAKLSLGTYWGITDALLIMPFFNMVAKFHGKLIGVDKKSIKGAMKTGKNLGMCVGGFEEATCTSYRKDRVYLKNRKGFVKMALRHGYALQPVYTFGESEAYYTFDKFLHTRLWLNEFNIPGVLFFGNMFFPLWPRTSAKLVTVFGDPIDLPKIDEPTHDDIFHWHSVYVEGLKKLFEDNTDKYGYPDSKLEIF